jgi:hypothetical protein
MKRFRFLSGLATLPILGPVAMRLATVAPRLCTSQLFVNGKQVTSRAYGFENAKALFSETLDEAVNALRTMPPHSRVFIQFNESMGSWIDATGGSRAVAGPVSWSVH